MHITYNYLQSSNGTFVNNQRLSKGSEESLPREVCSGDILQFGVDVMENSRKVTHGCIIATLKLFLPDGKEAKASPTIVSTPPHSLPTQDLYQLNQYIQVRTIYHCYVIRIILTGSFQEATIMIP